jgi:hypothetical protein
MPFYRRFTILIVLFVLLVAVAFVGGIVPMLRRWFGDWTAQAS